ncbi:Uncharacterised protein [Mycobacteroides abscessus subsp. abscessus]|nr:Uncharacterised protein [Mycobacteroides abscessus subsp. abscessus]
MLLINWGCDYTLTLQITQNATCHDIGQTKWILIAECIHPLFLTHAKNCNLLIFNQGCHTGIRSDLIQIADFVPVQFVHVF